MPGWSRFFWTKTIWMKAKFILKYIWSNMKYLEIFIKILEIFKILIALPFFIKSFIWAAKCPKLFKIQRFLLLFTQLVKKLQQWSLSEVIKDILPIVLNTKRPLSDIKLLRYKKNSFGRFLNNLKCWIFTKKILGPKKFFV